MKFLCDRLILDSCSFTMAVRTWQGSMGQHDVTTDEGNMRTNVAIYVPVMRFAG